jgi:hypothetical protein
MFGEDHLEPGLAKTIMFLKTILLLVQLNHRRETLADGLAKSVMF